jgi:hypothetical protein
MVIESTSKNGRSLMAAESLDQGHQKIQAVSSWPISGLIAFVVLMK